MPKYCVCPQPPSHNHLSLTLMGTCYNQENVQQRNRELGSNRDSAEIENLACIKVTMVGADT